MSNDTLPSVLDLSRALKERMRVYPGGFSAIWEKIDVRFKYNETKSIVGKIEKPKNKITKSAFYRAITRLAPDEEEDDFEKEVKLMEKMSFGIRGNPLLLMNIFEILGIKGYSDILTFEFKKPEVVDIINKIDVRQEELYKKIDALTDMIENINKTSNRTVKVNIDFETILKRLYSVLENNNDPESQYDFISMQNKRSEVFKTGLKMNENYMNGDPISFNKNLKRGSALMGALQRTSNFVNTYIYSFQPEIRRIAFLFLIFNDNRGYIYQNKILLAYYKQIEKINIQIDDSSILCILSPLFILLLFFQMTTLFLRKLKEEQLIADELTKDFINELSQTDNIKTYLVRLTRRFINNLTTMLNYFGQYEIKNMPKIKYDEYRDLAKEIINPFYAIFVDKKEDDLKKMLKLSKTIKTFEDLYKLKDSYISGIYNISKHQVEQFEILVNRLSKTSEATIRD